MGTENRQALRFLFLHIASSGLEDVIREHFRHQKEAVLIQCAAWLSECADTEEERRMRKAVDSLKIELDKL